MQKFSSALRYGLLRVLPPKIFMDNAFKVGVDQRHLLALCIKFSIAMNSSKEYTGELQSIRKVRRSESPYDSPFPLAKGMTSWRTLLTIVSTKNHKKNQWFRAQNYRSVWFIWTGEERLKIWLEKRIIWNWKEAIKCGEEYFQHKIWSKEVSHSTYGRLKCPTHVSNVNESDISRLHKQNYLGIYWWSSDT